MRISFPILCANDLGRFLSIMRTSFFLKSPVCTGYIRKVSAQFVQKYLPHDCSTDSISCSEQIKGI